MERGRLFVWVLSRYVCGYVFARMTIEPVVVRMAQGEFQRPSTRRLHTPPIQGESIVHHMFDEAFNQGNFAVVDKLLPPDCISHHLSWGIPANRMGLKQWIAMFRTAFPDLHCAVEDEIVQADR